MSTHNTHDPAQSALVTEAARYLQRALDWLDQAGEASAAPYVQMALDVLAGSTPEALDVPEDE